MVSFPCPWEEALTGGPDNFGFCRSDRHGPAPAARRGSARRCRVDGVCKKLPSASAAEGFTFWKKEESSVETRVAVLAIIVRDTASVPALNELLHQYAPYIIGRMGVPYHARGVNIISVAVDAPADAISALSGKIGRLAGITAKTVYAPEDALQQGK